MRFVRSWVVPAALASLILSGIAGATVMVPVTVEEMTKEAGLVARAKVLAKSAEWDQDHKRIYTHTTLEVVDAVLGKAPEGGKILVRSLGGERDGVGMRVAGTPSFELGEEVLLFLRADRIVPGAFRVIGMAQGKYRLVREAKGRWMAEPSLEGIAFAKKGPDGVLRVDESEASPSGRVPWLELRARIVKAAGAASASPSPSPTSQIEVQGEPVAPTPISR